MFLISHQSRKKKKTHSIEKGNEEIGKLTAKSLSDICCVKRKGRPKKDKNTIFYIWRGVWKIRQNIHLRIKHIFFAFMWEFSTCPLSRGSEARTAWPALPISPLRGKLYRASAGLADICPCNSVSSLHRMQIRDRCCKISSLWTIKKTVFLS